MHLSTLPSMTPRLHSRMRTKHLCVAQSSSHDAADQAPPPTLHTQSQSCQTTGTSQTTQTPSLTVLSTQNTQPHCLPVKLQLLRGSSWSSCCRAIPPAQAAYSCASWVSTPLNTLPMTTQYPVSHFTCLLSHGNISLWKSRIIFYDSPRLAKSMA